MFTRTEPGLLAHVSREIDAGEGTRLWLLRLDDDATHDALYALLSPEERERAASYSGTVRGRRFVRGRGSLRALLGSLLDQPPAALRFAYNRDGKPSLLEAVGEGRLQFNVSHARDLALIAVADGRRVGVDLASVEGESRLGKVVTRFFSAAERAAYEGAADDERRAVFARIWVRKEAYLKATGEGISERIYETEFSQLERLVGSGERVWDRAGAGGDVVQGEWEIRDIVGLPAGYAGSVALEHPAT